VVGRAADLRVGRDGPLFCSAPIRTVYLAADAARVRKCQFHYKENK